MSPVRAPICAGAQRDLLERLQTVGDERWHDDDGSLDAATGRLAPLDVRERLNPRSAAEPRLEADDPLLHRDGERPGDELRGSEALRAITVGEDLAWPLATVGTLQAMRSRAIALADLPLR